MNKAKDKREFTTVRLPKDLVTWLKVEAARTGAHIYTLIERRFPDVRSVKK